MCVFLVKVYDSFKHKERGESGKGHKEARFKALNEELAFLLANTRKLDVKLFFIARKRAFFVPFAAFFALFVFKKIVH